MVEQSIFKNLVELPLLLAFFSFLLTSSITTNLVIFRTCYIVLQYNISDCALLGNENKSAEIENLEKLVEPQAAIINMVRSLVEGSICGVVCLFVGPWTDRFGRKPVLIIPLIGFTLGYIIFAIISALPNVSPWYFMLTSIPVVLTGGGSTHLTVVLAYITDISSEINRGIRMGMFQAAITLGMLLGNILSSYLLYATSYVAVFLVSASCMLMAALFTIFFIPESLANRETENRLQGFFQLSNIKDMLKTTFKKRPNYDRFVVICCLISLVLYITAELAESSVVFLYLREKFSWSLRKYTLFSSAHNIAWIFGTMLGVYVLHKLLKIPETILMLIGFISALNGALLLGFATNDWFIYSAAGIRSVAAVVSPMIRCLISKIIPADEVGKVFCLVVTCEFIFSMAGSPIYTAIYNATINTNPAIFNFITAGICFIGLLITIVVTIIRTIKPVIDYNQLTNGDTSRNVRDADEIVM